jgi:rare lipoprotein A
MRNQLASLGAVTTTSYTAPRDRAYVVQIGPLPDVASADATLARARRAGATDARIIVD